MKEAYSKKRVLFLRKNKEYDALYRYCSSFALNHNLDAFFEVSKCYLHGWGVEKNEWHAFMIHKQLAQQDYPKAFYALAWDYYEGKGISINLKKAYQNFLLAARKGIVDAMFNVGIFCYNGLGIKKDLPQAMYWFTQAAALGHARAQFNLSICYERQNEPVQANYWLEQASSNGDELALRYLGKKNQDKEKQFIEILERLDQIQIDETDQVWMDKIHEKLNSMEEKIDGN